ncbi:hypothetical protein BDZ89DRAFT_279122 [Hymenopellis radicata]|nr:hypothetical protein BDZ89DRAFT_279122 [Hymenopellis radicata]
MSFRSELSLAGAIIAPLSCPSTPRSKLSCLIADRITLLWKKVIIQIAFSLHASERRLLDVNVLSVARELPATPSHSESDFRYASRYNAKDVLIHVARYHNTETRCGP